MTVAFSLILSFYCLAVAVIIWGWHRVTRKKEMPAAVLTQISIIVPFRNEAPSIKPLIESLLSLNYPKDHWEVILVNDHSSDQSMELARGLIRGYDNFFVHSLPADRQGKKQALKEGIDLAKFPIVATTDADCSIPDSWLKAISDCFQKEETMMAIGLVKLGNVTSLFGRLQAVELTSLMASTAAAIGWNHPLLCSGANLTFRKEAFRKVGGYDDNLSIASGDDEFLMRKIVKHFPGSIALLNSPGAVIVTTGQKNVGEFFSQRVRWAGKWKYNSDAFAQILAVMILVFQFSFVALVLLLPYGSPLVSIVFVKIGLEGLLIYLASKYLGQRFYLFEFLLLQPLYPIYILLAGVISLFITPLWKGRKLSAGKGAAGVIFS